MIAWSQELIHELREYDFTPENWPAYRRLFVEVARRVRADNYGRLLGAWEAQSIDATESSATGHTRFVHLWEYESLDARAALRKQLATVPGWVNDFLPAAAVLVHRQALSVLNPHNPSTAAEDIGAQVCYLHRASAKVGMVTRLLAQTEADAANWTTEFPDPNEVTWLTQSVDVAGLVGAMADVRALRSLKLTPLEQTNPTLIAR